MPSSFLGGKWVSYAYFYYKITYEIPGQLLRKNIIFSHVKTMIISSHLKISLLPWLHEKLHLFQQIILKQDNLVFHPRLYNKINNGRTLHGRLEI